MSATLPTADEIRAIVREEIAQARPVEPPPDVLTREEVAAMLRVSPVMVTRYATRDGLRGSRIGALWRFRRADVLAWLDDRAAAKGAHVERIGAKLRAVKGGA